MRSKSLNKAYMSGTNITVTATVNASLMKVWKLWTTPEDITKWCFASDDWHAPKVENDVKEGGNFSTRMEAKDGSMGFDFGGTYDKVIPTELIQYTIADGRKVTIKFSATENGTYIEETFEAETQNPEDMQKMGWQMILDNFKKYAEN
jgi:uncharacterized protein YndB with AHSA1/START domain